MSVADPLVIFTFVAVGLTGVLLLGAHQVDEAGHRRAGMGLLMAAGVALIGVVMGPYGLLGLLLIAVWYAVFIGLPILGVVLIVRRIRRKRPPSPQ